MDNIALQDVIVTLEAEYTQNDTLTFTISGAEFDTAASVPDVTAAIDTGDSATLGLLSLTSTSVTFRITAVDDADNDGLVFDGGTFTLSGMQLDTDTVVDATGDIDITYQALTNTNVVLDSPTGANSLTVTAIEVVQQLGVALGQAADGIIDVEADRLLFTGTITTDTIVATISETTVDIGDITYNGSTHVLTGSFSWMNTDTTAGVSQGELDAAIAMTGSADDTCTAAINTSSDEITFTCTDGGGNDVEVFTVTFTASGEILPAQSFTHSIDVDYDDAGEDGAGLNAVNSSFDLLTGLDVGAWTLNGSQVSIPYMPYGSVITQIIYASNEGGQTGASTLDMTFEDGTSDTCSLGNIAPGVTALAGMIRTCVEDSNGTASQKVALVITTNVPSSDIEVYSAYNVNTDGGNGDRVTVPNSSTHGLAATID
jgi:hypothetical protein